MRGSVFVIHCFVTQFHGNSSLSIKGKRTHVLSPLRYRYCVAEVTGRLLPEAFFDAVYLLLTNDASMLSYSRLFY